jgi:hypothetical protein
LDWSRGTHEVSAREVADRVLSVLVEELRF